MVAGLAFLSKKSFNPANISNQKQVWEAQQQTKLEEKRTKERQDQLRRERDDEELARARGGESQGDKATLNFMYKPPPGLEGPSKEAEETNSEAKSTSLATERQPGDDDAAAAFRQMLAAAATTTQSSAADPNEVEGDSKPSASLDMTSSGAALSGTSIEKTAAPNKDALTALEKAVGRKDASSSLTLQEQIARFPQLKNAPMAKGMSATNVGVTFKPLGTQLRNVRCMACGVWGHSRGDRECEASGWNPFAMTQPNNNNGTMSQQARRQQEASVDEQKRRSCRDSDDYSSDDSSEDSYQRRKRRRKHRKSRKESKRRKRRSSSPNDDRKRSRKSSHKKRKKHSRHD